MARAVGSLTGSKDYLSDFLVSAAVTASQILVREATAANAGEAASPAGTGSGGLTDTVDILGCATDQATYTATPTQNPGAFWPPTAGALENLVRVEVNPLAIYRFPVAAGATAGTALVSGDSSAGRNLITISTGGSKTVMTASGSTGNVGNVDMTGGLIYGKTGNNVGQLRKMTAFSSGTSVTVTVGFLNNTAVGDTFMKVPFSRACVRVQMTTDFTQANGIIAFGTGGAFRVLNVLFDETLSQIMIDVIPADHLYNPESA